MFDSGARIVADTSILCGLAVGDFTSPGGRRFETLPHTAERSYHSGWPVSLACRDGLEWRECADE